MNKTNYATKIKLNSFDDLFGVNDPISGAATEIKEIPLAELHEFKGHPFRVLDDEKMEELVASIKDNGVLVPGIARLRREGGYEIIAGHRRRRACELAGLERIPMFVKNLSDEDAILAMVDSNLQREDILPSEKAKAYQMRYEAIKDQGRSGNSLKSLTESFGESPKQIQRYIWLNRLIDELLAMVDAKKLPLSQGVELSFLLVREQKMVLSVLTQEQVKISLKQAELLKKMSQSRELENEADVRRVLMPERKTKQSRKVTIKPDVLDEFFDESYGENEISEIVISLLRSWKESKEGKE